MRKVSEILKTQSLNTFSNYRFDGNRAKFLMIKPVSGHTDRTGLKKQTLMEKVMVHDLVVFSFIPLSSHQAAARSAADCSDF